MLDERLVLVVGTKLETYYLEQLLPPFVAAYAEIAAACVQLSRRVGGQPGFQVRRERHIDPAWPIYTAPTVTSLHATPAGNMLHLAIRRMTTLGVVCEWCTGCHLDVTVATSTGTKLNYCS